MQWYSLFVPSFADSNGDGIGDLKGIINSLDYFVELGVVGIWLSPIHPAPSYHKYDVVDYYDVDPTYGTMDDFKNLIFSAHEKGIKIMLDMVFNHCSEEHTWFQEALKSKDNSFRNYFNWMKASEVLKNNLNDWHVPEKGPVDECYYGLFWKGMPDLNFDNPLVRSEIIMVANFWISLGVDALRLDAAMHIFPKGREKDNTFWWQEFKKTLGEKVFLVGEITESCNYIAPYLKNGLTSAFNFELADLIIKAIQDEKQNCLADWLKNVHENYRSKDKSALDSIFLSNHDQERIASCFDGNIEKIKLAASILFTLPGVIFMYYGEELGMFGRKPDEYVRECFPWTWKDSEKRCKWLPSKYNLPSTLPSYEVQKTDTNSVFKHYQTLSAIRKNNPALENGSIENVICKDPAVLIFQRIHLQQKVLVMHNLSNEDLHLKHEDVPFDFEIIHHSAIHPFSENGNFYLPAFGSLMVDVKM